jgi:hypothetical protein
MYDQNIFSGLERANRTVKHLCVTSWCMLDIKETRPKSLHTRKTTLLATLEFIKTVCIPYKSGKDRKVIWNPWNVYFNCCLNLLLFLCYYYFLTKPTKPIQKHFPMDSILSYILWVVRLKQGQCNEYLIAILPRDAIISYKN